MDHVRIAQLGRGFDAAPGKKWHALRESVDDDGAHRTSGHVVERQEERVRHHRLQGQAPSLPPAYQRESRGEREKRGKQELPHREGRDDVAELERRVDVDFALPHRLGVADPAQGSARHVGLAQVLDGLAALYRSAQTEHPYEQQCDDHIERALGRTSLGRNGGRRRVRQGPSALPRSPLLHPGAPLLSFDLTFQGAFPVAPRTRTSARRVASDTSIDAFERKNESFALGPQDAKTTVHEASVGGPLAPFRWLRRRPADDGQARSRGDAAQRSAAAAKAQVEPPKPQLAAPVSIWKDGKAAGELDAAQPRAAGEIVLDSSASNGFPTSSPSERTLPTKRCPNLTARRTSRSLAGNSPTTTTGRARKKIATSSFTAFPPPSNCFAPAFTRPKNRTAHRRSTSRPSNSTSGLSLTSTTPRRVATAASFSPSSSASSS